MKTQSGCKNGDRCSFAHLDQETFDQARRLSILIRPDRRKFRMCITPGCKNLCQKRECHECYFARRKLERRRSRSRSKSPPEVPGGYPRSRSRSPIEDGEITNMGDDEPASDQQ